MAMATLQPSASLLSGASEEERKVLAEAGAEGGATGFEELLPGLTEDLEKKLLGLVKGFEQESYQTWRGFHRGFLEAEAFWNDIHTGYYDHVNDTWAVPTFDDLQKIGESGQRFNYHTNFYKAWGWSILSVLGQKVPKTRFLPVDFQNPKDVMAAEEASGAAKLIERNNKVNLLNLRGAYLLYTHGVFGAYARTVTDEQMFGARFEPVLGLVPTELMAGGYDCPECNEFTEAEPGQMDTCPACSTEMDETNYVPPVAGQMPQTQGQRKVPKGQEVITIYGGLELRMPPWTSEMREWPYLGKIGEYHKAILKATYGKRAKDLSAGDAEGGSEDSSDRYARLSLVEPNVAYFSSANKNLFTVKCYWLRPDAFQMLEGENADANTQTLLELFPEGVKVVFSGDKVLDAAPEKMDDHWEICRGMEGPGNYKPALGKSAIPVNKTINASDNFILEWLEYQAAGEPTLVNVGTIGVQALTRKRKAPGQILPVKFPPNIPMANVIHQGRPGQIAGEVFTIGQRREEVGRTLTGATPTLTGGTDMSLKPTTYLADREQALGRMFVPWSNLRMCWTGTIFKAVKEFAKNRTEDERYSLPGVSGKVEGVTVRLNSLQDGQFNAYPETDEEFPSLYHEARAMFLKLMESTDPFIQEIMGHPKNIALSKAMLGVPDAYIPDQDNYVKQQLEIEALMQEAPSIEPQTDGSLQTTPSVLIDGFADNHAVHAEAVREWAVSIPGIKAKRSNPQGYANVIAHGEMHEAQVKMAAMAEAMAAAPAAGEGSALKKTNAPPADASKRSAEKIEKQA